MISSLLDGYRLLHDGALALAEVERAGIGIDVEYCREKLVWLNDQLSRYERRLRSSDLGRAWIGRFGDKTKFSSNQQLQPVLYVDLGVKPIRKTASDQDAVDEDSLKQVAVDGIQYLLRQRSLKKCADTLRGFLKYQIDGRLHPNYNLHTVVTYRGSSSDPNMQNVPHRDPEQKEICRRAIVPSQGNILVEIDKSGIEVCVAACYHQDPAMLAYLRDPVSDMHADAARQLFFLDGSIAELRAKQNFREVLRQAGKNGFIFPEFYGDYFEHCAPNVACNWCKLPRIGTWTDDDGVVFDGEPIGAHLRRQVYGKDGRGRPLTISCLDDYTEHVKAVERWLWRERFPVYSEWKERWYEEYQRSGSFRMMTGFECSGVMRRNQAVNFPVQGPAFHLLLQTLVWVVRRIRDWRSRVVGQVHDSLLIDAAPDEVPGLVAMVRRIAAEELPALWDWIIVPIRVEASTSEVDGSWAKMSGVE